MMVGDRSDRDTGAELDARIDAVYERVYADLLLPRRRRRGLWLSAALRYAANQYCQSPKGDTDRRAQGPRVIR